MKTSITILSLLLLFSLTTSLQCHNCSTKPLRLGSTKSWFPLKGKTQLTFIDGMSNPHVFSLKVIDTTEMAYNEECDNSYQYQYINTSLYLNSDKTDSIYFTLGSGDWLCMNALSNDSTNISICNVFGETKEGLVAKSLNDYTIGNRKYKDVVLTIHNQGFSDNIDSVFIANNAGIVGFKYAGKTYSLQ